MADGRRRAVFLDRDGTIVEDPPPGFLHEPGKVKLLSGAAAALDIDVGRSWWVGDRMADVQPARALGGKGILVSTGEGNLGQGQARANGVTVVADLAAAVEQILH